MRRLPLTLAAVFFAGFVLLPLGVMLAGTVWSGEEGFTLAAWGRAFADPLVLERLGNSLVLGLVATALAVVFGAGHAWLTVRTDLPGARVLGPLGVAPLVVPPILVAMGFADLMDPALPPVDPETGRRQLAGDSVLAGFWGCAFLLGTVYAPFVAVLTARGLRSIDGRMYEAALLARGPRRSQVWLLRGVAPELLAGALFAFLFVVSEHGVPEFLTVKGKQWHTYAEHIFSRWRVRALGMGHEEQASPVVAAVPLVLILAVVLLVALRLRAARSIPPDFRCLPVRRLGRWRWPALGLPLAYLTAGVVVPVVVMAAWAAGSTAAGPMTFATFEESFGSAYAERGADLANTMMIGVASALVLVAVALPLARVAARHWRGMDHLSALPLMVPAILLGVGLVKVYNSGPAMEVYAHTGDFYDSRGLVACGYAARYLPFGVLALSSAMRRIPVEIEHAARLSGRSAWAQAWQVRGPLVRPAVWSVLCLAFILGVRELDLAVMLPEGNDTVVRALSNVVHFGGEDMGGALSLLLLFCAVLLPALTVIVTGRKLRSLS